MLVAQVLLLLLSVSTTLVQVQASENPKPESNQNSSKVSVESSGSSGQRPPVASQVVPEQSNNPDNWQVAIIEPEEGVPIEPPQSKSEFRVKSNEEKNVDFIYETLKEQLKLLPLQMDLDSAMNFPKDILALIQAQLALFESVVKESGLSSTEQDRWLNDSKVNQIRDDINKVTQMGGQAMLDRLSSEYEVLKEDKRRRAFRLKCLSEAAFERRVANLKTKSDRIIDAVARLRIALRKLYVIDKFLQGQSVQVAQLRALFDAKDLSQPKFKKAEKKWLKVIQEHRAFRMVVYKGWLESDDQSSDFSELGKDFIDATLDAFVRHKMAMKEAKRYIKGSSMLAKVAYPIGKIVALGAFGTALVYWLKPEWFNRGTGAESNVTQADLNSTSSTTIESTQLPSSLNSVYIAILVVLAMAAIVAGLVYYYFAGYLKNRKRAIKGKDPEAGKVATDLQSTLTPGHKSSKGKRSFKQSPSGFSPSGFNDSTGACTTANSSGKNRPKTSSVPSSAV